MNLVERVKAILLDPKSEWKVIEEEPGDIGYLLTNYVAILAVIPAVRPFIGGWLIGLGQRDVSFFNAFTHAIFIYLLTLVSVVVVGYIIDFLATTFGGRSNIENAMKVAAYAPTAAWLASVFTLIPFFSILGLLGLYSLYLLHTGVATLMKPASDKALIYTIAIVLCAIVIEVVLVFIFFLIFYAIFGTSMTY
jgi:hypothetical protein